MNPKATQAIQPMARLGWLALLLGIACIYPYSLQAAGGISAYVDSQGRVVFVNEAAPSPSASADSSRPVITSTATESSIDPAKPLSGEEVPEDPPRPRQGHLEAIIEETAAQHQIDPELVRAIIQVESNFNPYAVSPRGARGLMQLIPGTARRFGVQNSFDPRSNLDGGIRYLKYLMRVFGGDLQLSLAAYNAGEDAVARNRGIPPFRETRNYLRKITQIYPLRPLPAGSYPVQRIVKFVDSRGIVHFSNTDLP